MSLFVDFGRSQADIRQRAPFGRLRLARHLVEADVGDLVQVDAAAGAGARADVEGGIVCNHLGEDI